MKENNKIVNKNMRRLTSNEIGQKFFLISGIFLPILFEYATPLSSFTIGDFLLVLSIIFLVVTNRRLPLAIPFAGMLIYVVLDTVIIKLMGGHSSLFRAMRYMVYLSYPILLPKCMEYKEWAVEVYKKVAVFSAFFMILQTILLKLFKVFLPGVLTFLPLTDSSLYNYQDAVLYTNSGRCMSVFGEPSHYSIYVLPCVLLFLHAYDLYKRRTALYGALLISGSVFLCASFTGIFGLMFVWVMWVYSNIKKSRMPQRVARVILEFGIVCICFLIFTGAGSYLTNMDIYSRQSSGRFEGFIYIKDLYDGNTISEKMFGYGMNDIGYLVYLSGWPRMLFYFGIIGAIVFECSFIGVIKKHGVGSKIVYLMLLLMIGSEMNFGPFVVPYFMFIVLLQKTGAKYTGMVAQKGE